MRMRISVTDGQAQINTAGQDYTSSLQRDSKRVASLWTSVVTSVFVDILKLYITQYGSTVYIGMALVWPAL